VRIVLHIVTVVGALVASLLMGGFVAGVDYNTLFKPVDLVTSATEMIDAPSGDFDIFINRRIHTDPEVLGHWVEFFKGNDVPLIMEDVSCTVSTGDMAGLEMAESLASRLPANQMKIRVENGTIAISKAEYGRFDVIVLSAETADALDVSKLSQDEYVEVVLR